MNHSSTSAEQLKIAFDPSYAAPPLCQALVLPASESRFSVLLADLARAEADCELKVYAVSGKPLLLLKITNGERLDVKLTQIGSQPRCSIRVPVDTLSPFEILSAKDAPYGSFQCVGKGIHEVSVQGRTILVVDGECSSLKFSVTTPSGTPTALARINTDDYGAGESFEIRAMPGADSVLVIAVLMAIAIFTSSDPS